jgi:hypothetical protein
MLFIAIVVAFVVVIVTCMIMINRWMVAGRPRDNGKEHE